MTDDPQRSDLPHAPLELAHPLAFPGPEAQGAVLATELRGDVVLPLLTTLHLVLEWSVDASSVRTLEPDGLAAWELAMLERSEEPDPWSAAAVVAGQIMRGPAGDPDLLARACLALSEWALQEGAAGTALAFAEAAALAVPADAGYAWIAGRCFRHEARLRDAEHWFQRALRVATWQEDRETQVLALVSLGNLRQHAGRYRGAEEHLLRALRTARKYGLREPEARALHDLALVDHLRGDHAAADRHARRAFERYGPEHPNRVRLAYDIARMWLDRDRHAQALPVLRTLIPRLAHLPDVQLRARASVALAAGAAGDREGFVEAAALFHAAEPDTTRIPSAALLDIGLGALAVGEWETAVKTLRRAIAAAEAQGERDVAVRAEHALGQARRQEPGPRTGSVRAGLRARSFAQELVSGLEAGPQPENAPCCDPT